ncbi:MAG: hypothetical protein CM15mP77_1480 [Synechococcus sp.]|nr:MAG: hypothetical protein CM15mP77_1480 [Synechococcus sp.]
MGLRMLGFHFKLVTPPLKSPSRSPFYEFFGGVTNLMGVGSGPLPRLTLGFGKAAADPPLLMLIPKSGRTGGWIYDGGPAIRGSPRTSTR